MSKITGSSELLYSGIVASKGTLKLNIPYYQRPYSWEEDQLEDFWTSIQQGVKVNEDLFFGSVITTNTEKVENSLDIVDGQQRIVTFSILFLALYNKYKNNPTMNTDFSSTFEDIKRFLMEKTGEFRLSTLEADKPFFEEIKKTSIIDILKLEDKKVNNNFLYAYKFFSKQINEVDFDDNKVKNLINFITDKIQVIHITAPDEATAIDTFQTINSLGMPLDEENIAKSILLSQKVQNDKSLIKEWEFVFRTDKFNNADFFNYYLAIEYATDLKRSALLRTFFNKLQKLTDEEKIVETKKIIKYAEHYIDILDEVNQHFKNTDYFYCVKTFKELGTWVFLPVLMKAIYENQNIEQVANNLESIIMSYALEGRPLSGFNKMLPNLLKDAFSIKPDYKINFITEYLTSSKKKNKKVKSILYLLEIKQLDKHNSNTIKVFFNENLSLEHIYPQNNSQQTKELTNPDLLHSIGNMMILSPSWNSKSSNKPFIEKLKLYTKDTIGFLQTSDYVSKQAIEKEPIWLDKQIEENAKYILGLIKTTWINKA